MPLSTDVLYTAVTIYKEARGEPFQCQVLVAKVVRNRMIDGKTAKQVVKEKGQFSWTPMMRGKTIKSEYERILKSASYDDKKAMEKSVILARRVLQPGYDTGNNLLYFHSHKGYRYDVKCGKLYFSQKYRKFPKKH